MCGGGPPPPKVVQEIIYMVDDCRPPIMERALEYTLTASRDFEECARKAAYDMFNNNQSKLSKDMVEKMKDIAERIKNNERADAEFCYNIEKKYKPFGIEAPVGLNCQKFEDYSDSCREKNPNAYDASCETGKKPSPTPPRDIDENGNNIPNVVVLGNTGVGKSYYGNGLMGNLDPNTGYFGTSDSHLSCTRGASGVSGYFYDQLLTSYNVEPMLMNFYDTPGFADSDPCQIEKNKERIASTMDKPIDAFIFLTHHDNSRINANQQMLFKMLNEWTMGHIWNNLIIGYPRMTFFHGDRMNRADNGNSYLKELDIKKNQIKKSLWQMATDQEWKKRDENDQLVPMEQRDFDNIRVNALNVHQNKVCQFTSDGRIDKRKSDLQRCSQLAYFDESMDYILSDESIEDAGNSNPFDFKSFEASEFQFSNPFESNPFESNRFERDAFETNSQNRPRVYDDKVYELYDDKWIFIEEAKKLQQIIKEFSNHPVTPQKLYWQRKYNKDKEAYIARYEDSEIELSTEAFESVGIDTTQCEEERNRALAEVERNKRNALQDCDNRKS